MDEYTERVTRPLRAVYAAFEQGDATLLDLSRVAAQVAMTLDNAHAELLSLLLAADGDLEHGYYATEREEHAATGERVFAPILAQLSRE